MNIEEELINSALESNKRFAKKLEKVITQELKMNIAGFSKASNVPASTLYKIISEKREPNLDTFRKIVKAIRKIRGLEGENKFIALLGAKTVLDKIEKTSIKTNGDEIKLKEYTANTIDEVVFSSLQAEKDGATALICAPTISSTIENIIDIPVVTIMPKSSINKAVEIATKKIKNR